MQIEYLGHSCFYLSGEYSVVIDPFKSIGFDVEKRKVDFCLSSHSHFDHNALDMVEYKQKICSLADKDKARAIDLEIIKTYHDKVLGQKRGENLVYKFTLANLRFCHLGDIGEEVCKELYERIGGCDVLFLPIGGNFTIDFKSAIKLAKLIKPKFIIPMHYRTARSRIEIDTIDNFLNFVDFEVVKVGKVFDLKQIKSADSTVIVLPDSSSF